MFSTSTHICIVPSRYNFAYSSGSSMASTFNEQTDPGVVYKSFSASQQSIAFVYGKTKLHVFGIFPICAGLKLHICGCSAGSSDSYKISHSFFSFLGVKNFCNKKVPKNATLKDDNSLTLIGYHNDCNKNQPKNIKPFHIIYHHKLRFSQFSKLEFSN